MPLQIHPKIISRLPICGDDLGHAPPEHTVSWLGDEARPSINPESKLRGWRTIDAEVFAPYVVGKDL